MGSGPYSARVTDHFLNPRNVGTIRDADAVGEVGSAASGTLIRLYLKIDDRRITDAKFRVMGCSATIASGSVLTELIKGRTLDEARGVTSERLVEALDGLPADRLHCAALAANANQAAIAAYDGRRRC